ncbi:hypothetical protein [Enterococcus sp. AZ196]|uniref:hypothetical protein n=1 Tax=Enterococcus sp. AZ196 TaxID=2774659 RepID=UPI003D291DE9
MNYFTIETHELKNLDTGWRSIGITTILADNPSQALKKVSDFYCENQYSHQIIYMIDAEYEEETIIHFLDS